MKEPPRKSKRQAGESQSGKGPETGLSGANNTNAKHQRNGPFSFASFLSARKRKEVAGMQGPRAHRFSPQNRGVSVLFASFFLQEKASGLDFQGSFSSRLTPSRQTRDLKEIFLFYLSEDPAPPCAGIAQKSLKFRVICPVGGITPGKIPPGGTMAG